MPKRAKRLTQKTLDEWVCPARGRLSRGDGVVPGLRWHASARHRKYATLFFRDPKATNLLIGYHPSLSVLDARTKASAALQSGNPRSFLRGDRPATTRGEMVGDLARLYIERKLSDQRSAKDIERRIVNQLIPAFGDLPISKMTKNDMSDRFAAIVKANGPSSGQALFSLLNRILKWAASNRDNVVNPLAGMSKPGATNVRERILTHDEIKRFWHASFDDEIPVAYGAAWRVMLLTGCRRSEIARLHSSEVNGVGFEIPSTRSKNKKPHAIPLVGLLKDEFKKLDASGYKFSTTDGQSPITDFSHYKKRLDKAMGCHDWVTHDLRRTARSLMAEIGIEPHIAEKVLNHAPRDQMIAIYDRHSYQNEIKDAVAKLSRKIRTIIK